MKNKSLYLVAFLVFGLFFTSQHVYATSGACSDHGGVDCGAGAAPDGSAVCNDGTESSVAYADMDECSSSSDCPLPAPDGCSTQADYQTLQQTCQFEQLSQQSQCGEEKEELGDSGAYMDSTQANALLEVACDGTPTACSEETECQAQITQYQDALQQNKQCLATEEADQQQEEQLQQQSEQQNETQLQQQQEAQQQETQNTYTEEYDAVCSSLSVPNGTPIINSAGKCVPSCDQGYEDVGDASCQPISSPSVSAVTTPAITQIVAAKTEASQEKFLPVKGVSTSIATDSFFGSISHASTTTSKSKSITPMPTTKASLWQVVGSWIEKLNPFHWF